MIRNPRTRIAALLVLASAALALAGCTAAADPGTTPAAHTVTLDQACNKAQTFLSDGEPQKALDLIDAVRAPAVEALTSDAPLSAELQEVLEGCADQRRAAVVALSEVPEEAKPDPTFGESFAAAWKTANEKWFTPLLTPAIFFGATVVLLFLLARFATLLPAFRDLPATSDARQKRLLRWGIGGILASSLLLTFAVGSLGQAYTNAQPRVLAVPVAILAIIGFAVLALVFAAMFAVFLARRLRLTIDVYGKDGTATAGSAATFTALLATLAATPSRGIEVPDTADIDVLAGAALPDTPTNKVVEIVKNVLIFVATGTPWRVRVRIDADGKRGTVTMARNGAAYLDRSIDLTLLTLPKDADTVRVLQVFAAAAVIMGLRDRHPGFEGLAGTTDWQSLALTSLASSDYGTDDVSALLLLDQAVTLDPNNLTALVAREYLRARSSTKLPELLDYVEFLGGVASRLVMLRAGSVVTLATVAGPSS